MASATIRIDRIPSFRLFGARNRTRTAATAAPAPQEMPATLQVTRQDLDDGCTTVIRLAGDLGPRTYLQPLAVAQAAYAQGCTQLIVDLEQIERVSLSGLFALHAMACLFEGQPVPDPEDGIAGLRNAIEAGEGKPSARVRLLHVAPGVARTLAAGSGGMRLPVVLDVATACAEMAACA